jgi:hypothetical protein
LAEMLMKPPWIQNVASSKPSYSGGEINRGRNVDQAVFIDITKNNSEHGVHVIDRWFFRQKKFSKSLLTKFFTNLLHLNEYKFILAKNGANMGGNFLLLTPQNHGIAFSTICGHLRPMVTNIVSTKSLNISNYWFRILRFLGTSISGATPHEHFRLKNVRCQSGAELYFWIPKKNSYDGKFRNAIAIIMKSLKTQFLCKSNSATELSEIYKTVLSSNYFLLGGPDDLK